MKALLVRHCQTDRNRDGLVQGRADPPLNDTGRQQARRLAEALAGASVDAVYSSPLTRAMETAAVIAERHGRDVQPEPALIELDVGHMDGLTGAQMRERFPGFLESWLTGPDTTLRLPGGESLEEAQERAWAFLEAVVARGDVENVVCVSHNFVLLSVICRALRLPLTRVTRIQQSIGGLSVIDFRPGRIQLGRLNDTCHLGDSSSLVRAEGRC